MDPFQENYGNAGLAMLQLSQLDQRMTFYRQFAEEVFPNLLELDFVFIDASHLFDISLLEFVLADKKLRVGGVIAFHDLWMPSLQKLLRFILANRAYRISRPSRDSVRSQAVSPNESRWKRLAVSILQRIPLPERFLRQEVLEPWGTLNISNLVFIEKIAHDERDWRHFIVF